jgi:hypothetical protein
MKLHECPDLSGTQTTVETSARVEMAELERLGRAGPASVAAVRTVKVVRVSFGDIAARIAQGKAASLWRERRYAAEVMYRKPVRSVLQFFAGFWRKR